MQPEKKIVRYLHLTSCFMELKGNVSINSKGEVIVDHTERECVSTFFCGLKVLILCYINAPSIQMYNFPICYVAQDLANWLICVAGMEGDWRRNRKVVLNIWRKKKHVAGMVNGKGSWEMCKKCFLGKWSLRVSIPRDKRWVCQEKKGYEMKVLMVVRWAWLSVRELKKENNTPGEEIKGEDK